MRAEVYVSISYCCSVRKPLKGLRRTVDITLNLSGHETGARIIKFYLRKKRIKKMT